jgi:hypothetical protein
MIFNYLKPNGMNVEGSSEMNEEASVHFGAYTFAFPTCQMWHLACGQKRGKKLSIIQLCEAEFKANSILSEGYWPVCSSKRLNMRRKRRPFGRARGGNRGSREGVGRDSLEEAVQLAAQVGTNRPGQKVNASARRRKLELG